MHQTIDPNQYYAEVYLQFKLDVANAEKDTNSASCNVCFIFCNERHQKRYQNHHCAN